MRTLQTRMAPRSFLIFLVRMSKPFPRSNNSNEKGMIRAGRIGVRKPLCFLPKPSVIYQMMFDQDTLKHRRRKLRSKTAELLINDPAQLLISIRELAYAHQLSEDIKNALKLYQQALSIRVSLMADQPNPSQDDVDGLIADFHAVGLIHRMEDRLEEAQKYYQRALDLTKKTYGEKSLKYATRLNYLSGLYNAWKRYDEAERLIVLSLDIYRELLGRHLYTSLCMLGLALILRSQGKIEEAERVFNEAEGISNARGLQAFLENAWDQAGSLNLLCQLYFRQKKYEEAEVLFRHTLLLEAGDLWPDHPTVGEGLQTLGELYLAQRLDKQALHIFARAYGIFDRTLPENHPKFTKTAQALARLSRQFGDFDQSERLLKQVVLIKVNAQPYDERSHKLALDEYSSLVKEAGKEGDPEYVQILSQLGLSKKVAPLK